MELKAIGDRIYGMRRKLATWGLFLFAAYVAVHVVFGANGWMVYEKKKSEYRQVTADVEDLKQKNQQQAEYNKALQSDSKTIEKVAREQWKYAKPREVIIMMPSTQPKPDVTSTAQNKGSKK